MNEKHYHGTPCSKCGSTVRYKSNGACYDCTISYGKKWVSENKERVLRNQRNYRDNNREKVREFDRKWTVANRDSKRRSWHKWVSTNGEYNRKRVREYQRENRDKIRPREHARRTKIKGNGGSYTPDEWFEMCQRYNMRCLSCGKEFAFEDLTVDHVKPVAMGGDSFITNLQPLCSYCNSSKGARHIDYRPDGEKIKRWIQDRLL